MNWGIRFHPSMNQQPMRTSLIPRSAQKRYLPAESACLLRGSRWAPRTLISTLPKQPLLPRSVPIRTPAVITQFIATALIIYTRPFVADRRCRPLVDAVRGRAGFSGCDPAQVAAASVLAVHGTGFDVAQWGGLDPVFEAVDGVGAA